MRFQEKVSCYYELIRQRKFRDAEEFCLESLEEFPDNTYFQTLLANALVKQNRLSEALDIVEQVLETENNADALAIKGIIFMSMNKSDQAIEMIEMSLTQRENHYYRSQIVQSLLKLIHGDLHAALSRC